MDFLNKAATQVVELFQSMTVGARITTALLLVAVVVSLGYLYNTTTSGPEVDLLGSMIVSSREVLVMQEAFGKKGLNSYRIEGSRIYVPRRQRADYMAALSDAKALPASFDSYSGAAGDDGSWLPESREQREQRDKVQKQEQLQLMIKQMRGVDSVMVLIDSGIKGGLNRQTVHTASVTVKPIGNAELDEELVGKIKYVVCSSLLEMKPEDVTVIDTNGRAYHGSAGAGTSSEDAVYAQMQRLFEQQFKAKILTSLDYIPGVTVVPSVTLERDRSVRSREIKYDPKAVAWREMEQNNTRSRDSSAPGGRVGFAAQQPNAAASLSSARGNSSQEQDDESRRETTSVVAGVQTERDQVGLAPAKVSVAVSVPMSYFAKIWNERNPSEPGQPPKTPDAAALTAIQQEESTKIQKHVATLLPAVAGVDSQQLVTVTAFQDIRQAEIPQPAATEKVIVWLGQSWTTLALVGLAGVSLIILRSMLRGGPPAARSTEPSTGPVLSARVGETPGMEKKPDAPARLRRFQSSGKSLRDELTELVTEDPDIAANILKSWIGHVG